MNAKIKKPIDEKKPDAANSYERSRPEEQSPAGELDQEKPPVAEMPDAQDRQNGSPSTPPQSRKHDHLHESKESE